MKLVIEVENGMLRGVYYTGKRKPKLPILVIDLDGVAVGEAAELDLAEPEPIGKAHVATKKALTP